MFSIQKFLISKIFPGFYKDYQNRENDYDNIIKKRSDELREKEKVEKESKELKDKVLKILNMDYAILKIVEREFETLLIYADYRLDGKSIYMDTMYQDRVVILHFDIQEEYLDNQYSNYPLSKKMEIVDFIVSKKYRGTGYGSEVMSALICLAKNLKCSEIYGGISPKDYKKFTDENNILKEYPNDFYRKHGFIVSEKTGRISLNLKNK